MISFYALQVYFEKTYYTNAEEPDKVFRARLKEKTFAFVGKLLQNVESTEIFCFHRLKTLTVSVGAGYKTLREWIRCL